LKSWAAKELTNQDVVRIRDSVVFREERQNALARHGLGRNRISYGGHPVSEADALVPGMQTLEGVPDDDIVHVVASAMEGPNLATDLVPEAK
jgi:hypothetical protein